MSEELQLESGIAAVNGTHLYYEVAGEGFPLVLLHDGLLDNRIWDEQVKALAPHYRVIRYDARGYGKSETPHTKYSEVQDLLGLLQFLRVEKAYLLGTSNGGKIALDFTLEYPELVAALIAVGPTVSGYAFSEEKLQRIRAIWSVAEEKGVSGLVEAWLADPFWSPVPSKIAVRKKIRAILTEKLNDFMATPNFRLPLEPPAIQRLNEIKIPTLLIIGDKDDSDNFAIVNLLEKGIVEAKKVVIAEAGHMVNMEQPQEFNQAVSEFLGK